MVRIDNETGGVKEGAHIRSQTRLAVQHSFKLGDKVRRPIGFPYIIQGFIRVLKGIPVLHYDEDVSVFPDKVGVE